MRGLLKKIFRQFRQPINIYLFHQVSDEFDPNGNYPGDWTRTDKFKEKIMMLKKSFIFISLDEAFRKLNDKGFRFKRYAVLTSDDGCSRLLDLIPFFEEQEIPVTFFVNAKYLDGVSGRENGAFPDVFPINGKYITLDQLMNIKSEFVTIGSHGYEHNSCLTMDEKAFIRNIDESERVLKQSPLFKPFYAYTYGEHTTLQDELLISRGYKVLYCGGLRNYKSGDTAYRISIDEGARA